ncbi:hypothetical protein DYP75_002978 [Escherichia coli]|uniref:hypothetical protein n=1 Tax=Escherichia coli TaxID=562 RepID=UPI002879A1E6|nr:hypothetical protein [Escherichia coli]EHN9301092.1 hypothetical protein [Escherichia coli]EIC2311775.1 hypothetical protein [Escherichia coli]EIG6702168.1 hypothetical protein [Escherichia coli]EIG8056751.1 hypothetical protein [Escherichia coli]
MFNGLTDAKVNALLNDAKQKAANPGTNENERAMAVAIWELAEEVKRNRLLYTRVYQQFDGASWIDIEEAEYATCKKEKKIVRILHKAATPITVEIPGHRYFENDDLPGDVIRIIDEILHEQGLTVKITHNK